MTDRPLRNLTRQDIPACQKLRDLVNFNQTDADWELLLDLDDLGLTGIHDGNKLIATVSAIAYPPPIGRAAQICPFGWIGMMLVDPEYRGQGLAKKLMAHAIKHLQVTRRVAAVKLDATPLGKQVYDNLGFRDLYTIERMIHTPTPDAFAAGGAAAPGEAAYRRTRPMTNKVAPAIMYWDSQVFGADRRFCLLRWQANWPAVARWLPDQDGQPCAYGLARRGAKAESIGPILARDWVSAETMLAAMTYIVARETNGARSIYCDVVTRDPEPKALAERAGYTTLRPLTRQVLGEDISPDNPDMICAIGAPELG
ncbi:MAG TPA: GNAT family N-acetyltransferase [Planctomycetota bacterium]|nr:GNAT family N-acetyltransferase [Planctomycetota bacterium]